jgi:hypothetical protein
VLLQWEPKEPLETAASPVIFSSALLGYSFGFTAFLPIPVWPFASASCLVSLIFGLRIRSGLLGIFGFDAIHGGTATSTMVLSRFRQLADLKTRVLLLQPGLQQHHFLGRG